MDKPESTNVRKEPPIVKEALKLIDSEGTTIDSCRAKGLGLQLVLMGLAEVQAQRVSKLMTTVQTLEAEVFDEKAIREMPIKDVTNLYKMAKQSLDDSAAYIKDTLGSIKWNDLESQLVEVLAEPEEGKSDNSPEINKVAKDLLAKISSRMRVIPGGKMTG